MKLDNSPGSSGLMKPVHILCYQCQAPTLCFQLTLQGSNGIVGRVGAAPGHDLRARGIGNSVGAVWQCRSLVFSSLAAHHKLAASVQLLCSLQLAPGPCQELLLVPLGTFAGPTTGCRPVSSGHTSRRQL